MQATSVSFTSGATVFVSNSSYCTRSQSIFWSPTYCTPCEMCTRQSLSISVLVPWPWRHIMFKTMSSPAHKQSNRELFLKSHYRTSGHLKPVCTPADVRIQQATQSIDGHEFLSLSLVLWCINLNSAESSSSQWRQHKEAETANFLLKYSLARRMSSGNKQKPKCRLQRVIT